MKTPIRFGRALTVESNGQVSTMQEEVYANFGTVKRVTLLTETLHVKDDKEILAEFLKLLDRQKTGEIDLIGLQCLRDRTTGRMRIEKSWVIPDLR